MKLTRTDGQADRQTGGQDHVLSQADALTKKSFIEAGCAMPKKHT